MVEFPDSELRLRLRVALKVMMALAAIASLVIGVRFLGGAGTVQPQRARIDVSDMAPGAVRTVGLGGRPVIVLRRSAALVDALGAGVGPHPGWFVAYANGTANGCTIVWEPEPARFRESCSTAAWDAAGQPIEGTDAAPLDAPRHRLTADGQLVLGAGA